MGRKGENVDAPDKVAAMMTDFPTQSEPVSGMERGAVELSERYIRENFLPPWIAAFRAGALGVMAGYPDIEGVPEHASEKWNTQILRNELGLQGNCRQRGRWIQYVDLRAHCSHRKKRREQLLCAPGLTWISLPSPPIWDR